MMLKFETPEMEVIEITFEVVANDTEWSSGTQEWD